MAVMAAWAWWQSMSSTEQETLQQSIVNSHANDDRESLATTFSIISIHPCGRCLEETRKAAGAKCRASAPQDIPHAFEALQSINCRL